MLYCHWTILDSVTISVASIKHDDVLFRIINFPLVCGNSPSAPKGITSKVLRSSYWICWLLDHLTKGHVSFCHQVSFVVRRMSSSSSLSSLSVVNILHFNLFLRNHWANLDQTLVEWSLDGPLSKLCPVIPASNQGARQAKNRKKGVWNCNCSLLL